MTSKIRVVPDLHALCVCWAVALLPSTAAWAAKPAAKPAAKTAPPPAALKGTVIQALGGDTLLFQPDANPDSQPVLTVKLHGIDAPEPCQPWGAEARQALAAAALRKPATLRGQGRDGDGRLLGDVLVDGELDLGRHLVEEGHAWSVRVRWDQGPLVKQERMAHALKRGLHAVPGAVMPRDFRLQHGPCVAGEPVAAAPARAPAGRVSAAPLTTPPAPPSRCDGRTRCSQMRSCDEARYFLAHCPDVQMDGDRDGVPCEQQWCGGAPAGRRRP